LDRRSEEEIVELAAITEKFSEHSIAKAILKKAKDLNLKIEDPDNFESRRGFGVIATYKDRKLIVGNKRLLEDTGIKLNQSLQDYLIHQETIGRTAILLAINSEPAGVINLADKIKEDLNSNINKIRRNGVKKIVMLTGDNRYVAEMISKQASIDQIRAEQLPQEKVEYITTHQRQGYKVAMIGDGVNDAPALATADVGIAMGISGTDISKETAGIVLTTDDLSKVSKIIEISRNTLSIIKQNVLFSLIVNLIGLVLSTQGMINPVMASIIHESSALIVVFNSLRLTTK
jgi:Cd2+/Zn2+-exporting ATPase